MVNMQVEILDHEYTAWKFQALIVEANNPNYDLNFEMKTKLNPLELKLITGDIVNNQGEIQIPSPYRGMKEIPGILVLNGKTYGRASTIAKEAIKEVIKEEIKAEEIKTETKLLSKEEKKALREETKAQKETAKALKEAAKAEKEAKKALPKEKKTKLLYKFIPDNKGFPIFLVPYEEKSGTFNKKKINRYALLKFKEWTDKHPIGVLTNTLGAVNEIEVFYDYQMYCKDLHVSLTNFIDETQKALEIAANETISSNSNEKIEDRISQGNEMFTIDPEGCDDYDDAFSIQGFGEYTLLSIHIANVPLLLDSLGLWEYFTDRVSTIYLPNGKKSMLPPILSDKLCSLQADKERLAFTMDVKVYNDGKKKNEIYFASNLIKVARNYVYEEPELLVNASYIKLLALAKHMNSISNHLDTIHDSHDVVAYFMIYMNYECSKILNQKRIGINRSTTLGYITANAADNAPPVPEDPALEQAVPKELKNFVKSWKCVNRGHYGLNAGITQPHIYIGKGLECYTHITSPIRRIVDLINLIELQQAIRLFNFSPSALAFTSKWLSKIKYINAEMKAIKKVQQNCLLVNALTEKYFASDDIQSIDKQVYEGFIIEKHIKPIKDKFKYEVYFPSLKTVAYFKSPNPELPRYKKERFNILLCLDESGTNLKQKIKLQMI